MTEMFLPVTAQAAASVPAATGAQPQPAGLMESLMSMLPLLVIFFAVMYFLVIRPQKKEQKRRQEMLDAVKAGDRVVTTGGIFGTVSKVMEDRFVLELAEGLRVDVVKFSIAEVVNPKTETEK